MRLIKYLLTRYTAEVTGASAVSRVPALPARTSRNEKAAGGGKRLPGKNVDCM